MTKAKDRKFKDSFVGFTVEEIIAKRARTGRCKLREYARAKKRTQKTLFIK